MAPILPNHYQTLRTRHPEFIAAMEALGKAIKGEGPLDEKTGEMIQLAAAASIHSEGSVHSHTRRALAAGATPDEIYHVLILLAGTIGFPSVAAALSWADDVIAGG